MRRARTRAAPRQRAPARARPRPLGADAPERRGRVALPLPQLRALRRRRAEPRRELLLSRSVATAGSLPAGRWRPGGGRTFAPVDGPELLPGDMGVSRWRARGSTCLDDLERSGDATAIPVPPRSVDLPLAAGGTERTLREVKQPRRGERLEDRGGRAARRRNEPLVGDVRRPPAPSWRPRPLRATLPAPDAYEAPLVLAHRGAVGSECFRSCASSDRGSGSPERRERRACGRTRLSY